MIEVAEALMPESPKLIAPEVMDADMGRVVIISVDDIVVAMRRCIRRAIRVRTRGRRGIGVGRRAGPSRDAIGMFP